LGKTLESFDVRAQHLVGCLSDPLKMSQNMMARMPVAPTAGTWWMWTYLLTRIRSLAFYCMV
jgi:hypothetical protein